VTLLCRRPVRLGALVVVVWAGFLLAAGCGTSSGAPGVEQATGTANWSYVIPRGTGERIDRGEPVEILPPEIDARVGDVIEIVNQDDRGHVVGPFYVGRHETVRQRFTSAGRFRGQCSVHPSGEVVLDVRS
jgi:hypothetical protein